jgi:hypothetical protein
VAVAIAIATAISVVVAESVAIAVAVTHCRHYWPLPLRSPLTIATAISVALLPAIAIALAITLTVGHCRLHHRQLSQLPSLLAITLTVAVGHFQELLPWRGKNCIGPIKAKTKNAYLILFCLESGRRTDQSRMTDQVSSGNGQHQRWAASGKHQGKRLVREVAGSRGAAGVQQGGDVN